MGCLCLPLTHFMPLVSLCTPWNIKKPVFYAFRGYTNETFAYVMRRKPATLPKVTLLHECFSYNNCTKSCKASHIYFPAEKRLKNAWKTSLWTQKLKVAAFTIREVSPAKLTSVSPINGSNWQYFTKKVASSRYGPLQLSSIPELNLRAMGWLPSEQHNIVFISDNFSSNLTLLATADQLGAW